MVEEFLYSFIPWRARLSSLFIFLLSYGIGELSLDVCMIMVCIITVVWFVLGSIYTSTALLPRSCIQLLSGNGVFRNKIEKFCCNVNLY